MASLHSLWQRIVPTFTVVKHMGTKETKLNINQNISRIFFSGCMWEMVLILIEIDFKSSNLLANVG